MTKVNRQIIGIILVLMSIIMILDQLSCEYYSWANNIACQKQCHTLGYSPSQFTNKVIVTRNATCLCANTNVILVLNGSR